MKNNVVKIQKKSFPEVMKNWELFLNRFPKEIHQIKFSPYYTGEAKWYSDLYLPKDHYFLAWHEGIENDISSDIKWFLVEPDYFGWEISQIDHPKQYQVLVNDFRGRVEISEGQNAASQYLEALLEQPKLKNKIRLKLKELDELEVDSDLFEWYLDWLKTNLKIKVSTCFTKILVEVDFYNIYTKNVFPHSNLLRRVSQVGYDLETILQEFLDELEISIAFWIKEYVENHLNLMVDDILDYVIPLGADSPQIIK